MNNLLPAFVAMLALTATPVMARAVEIGDAVAYGYPDNRLDFADPSHGTGVSLPGTLVAAAIST